MHCFLNSVLLMQSDYCFSLFIQEHVISGPIKIYLWDETRELLHKAKNVARLFPLFTRQKSTDWSIGKFHSE